MPGFQKPIQTKQIEGSFGESNTLKYVGSIIGDGIKTEFLIIHRLNTKDVNITIKQGKHTILVDWEAIDNTTIKINFDDPLDDDIELRIVIFG